MTAPPPEAAGLYDSRGKAAAEIESDIDHTRADLAAVLDALEHRLAPQQLLGRGVDMLKDSMSGDVGTMLREHPAPLALIGAGIGWLLVAATTGDKAAAAAHRIGDGITDAAHGVAARIGEEAESLPEPLYPAGEAFGGYDYARTKPRVGAAAAAVAERADHAFTRVCTGARRAIEANPLAFGAIGLLAGLALGMVLPRMGSRRHDAAGGLDVAEASAPVAD